MGEKGRGGRRKVRGGAGLSDRQSEGADNAVHGLVLPSHGAAPCGGRRRVALKTGRARSSEFSGSGQTLSTLYPTKKVSPSLFYKTF